MISAGEVVGQVYTVKLWDKNSALERLFKHLRLFDKGSSDQRLHNVVVSFVSAVGQKMSYSEFQNRDKKE